MLKNREEPAIRKKLTFAELADILEQLARKSKILKKYPRDDHFVQRVAGLTVSERQNIKSQVLTFIIPASGGDFVLDPATSIPTAFAPSVIPTVKQQRKFSCTGHVETDILRWLKDQKAATVLRDIKHRHDFTPDIHHGGLLSSSQFTSVYLMEAWPAELQSKAQDVHPCIAKSADCRLVCVKIAKCAEGRRQLQREGEALQALQDTGRVAELWNPQGLTQYLDRGVLITLYHPVPPPKDLGIDIFISLGELEEHIEQLTSVLVMLHKSRWIWLGLKPSHVLFLHSRMDPRDPVPPLRIIGLENARSLACTHNFVYAPDSIWAAPEVKTQQAMHRKQMKGEFSSDQKTNIESALTPAADMYSLGLLVSAHLARCPRPVNTSIDELCVRFNCPVVDASQKIRADHWLVCLAGDLLKDDPRLRPTAEQVLQRICSGRRDSTPLQMLSPSMFQIDGYIHPQTLQMVWPVVLKTKIITDQRDDSRLTDYVTVHAGIETPQGKIVADYKGRPVRKEFLRWLRHLKLHTHALNDGDRGAYDGRRKCNGVFDISFYTHFRQVRATLDIDYKKRNLLSQESMESSVVLLCSDV